MSLPNVLDLAPASLKADTPAIQPDAHVPPTNPALPTEEAAAPQPEPTPVSPRILANRANAEHSTGPVTDAGKAKMRFNALQHGLYSEIVVLPHEDQAAFAALAERLHAQYEPAGDEERQLVVTLQNTQWRLSRISALESGILAIAAAEQLESIDRLLGPLDPLLRDTLAQSAGYRANIRTLDQLSRHESRLRRILDRSRKELENRIMLRGARPALAAVQSPKPPAPVAVAAPAVGSVPSNPAPAVGSVPSNSAKTLPKMPKFSGPMRKQHRKEWLRKHAAQTQQEK